MNGAQLLTELVIAASLIFYLPDVIGGGNDRGGSHAGATTGERHSTQRFAADRPERRIVGETTLERSSDGHFYATAMVNGQETRFLVDTGASIVALTATDAQALGFEWSDSDIVPIGRGASGDVSGVPVVLDEVELEGIVARNINAAIVPDGLDVSLLGQTFLSQVDTLDVSKDRMTLAD